jgi:hypothetical protein
MVFTIYQEWENQQPWDTKDFKFQRIGCLKQE